MLFNYFVARTINDTTVNHISKKSTLIFGITMNLLLLGYFKYSDFFIENINLAVGTSVPLLHLALPLAISFFTFQQIAYLVDSYRGETKKYGFLNYALFVTFFPQLIAGPIVHHAEMMPQFAHKWNLVKNYRHILMGIFIFSIGLFKKVVIADTFAIWATAGFDGSGSLNLLEAWATSLSYTFQLYFDFSGYTDMAIGVALLFNIKLPINFNSPYKALDIQDFWRRWHITLSRFLKDYIYIPLGGNRKGSFRTYNNLMATFILGGIWHGAGWTFVFWGFLHGFALVVHRFWTRLGFVMPKVLAWFVTFNFINIAWVFFRAKEWDDAIRVLSAMFTLEVSSFSTMQETLYSLSMSGLDLVVSLENIINQVDTYSWIIFAFIIVLFTENTMQLVKKYYRKKIFLFYSLILLSIAILNLNKVTEFLYFNF